MSIDTPTFSRHVGRETTRHVAHQAVAGPIMRRCYPESAAGGFSRVDGVIEFFTRVNALITPESTVLDFGAGRGLGAEDPVPYRRHLRMLRGRVREVIGVDVDPVVLGNPGVDRACVIRPGDPLPLPDASVDLVVSENTFEHLAEPLEVAAEFERVLKPGGWLCARTPNRWGYIGLAANLVPNRWHVAVLRYAQPARQSRDVFPTHYRLNSFAQLRRAFPPDRFQHASYSYNPEPAYFGSSLLGWRVMQAISRLLPEQHGASLFVFLRKRLPR